MNPPTMKVLLAHVVFATAAAARAFAADGNPSPAESAMRVGVSVPLGERTAVLTRMESLPHVESDYTQRFRVDSFENPKLKQLRESYRLADVVAAGRDEFEQ